MEPPVLVGDPHDAAEVAEAAGGPAGQPAVVVRPVRAGDEAALAQLADDPDVRQWSAGVGGAPLDVERARRGWERGDDLALAVELGSRCAGVVALRPDGLGAAHLRAALLPRARGRRAASAAARLLLVWGFAQLGLPVVHWRAPVGDWAARRLAWACGFTVEGTTADLLPAPDGTRRDAWTASVRWGEPLRPRTVWREPTALAGGGVVLGPHEPDDVDRIAQACAAESTQTWLPGLPSPYTVLDAAEYVAERRERHADGTELTWAVRAVAGGELLATVGLFSFSAARASAEVGYWCHPDARRRGVTSAAVRLVAAHALAPASGGGLGLARLELKAAAANTGSRRVAERAGFTRGGVDRAAERLRDGTRADFVRYDLLAGEVTTPAPRPG